MNNIMEYVLCRDDIFYFTERYLDVMLRPYQIAQLSEYINTNTQKIDLLTISHRGSGMTLVNAIFVLWKVLFNPNINIGIIHANHSIQRNFEYVIDSLYSTMESKWDIDQSRYEISEVNHRHIKYTNSSRIIFSIYSDNEALTKFRGLSIDTLLVEDVFSMSNRNEEHFKDMIQGLSPNLIKNKIYTSTTLYESVHYLENDKYIKKMLIPWYCNCDLTLNWYKSKLNSLGNTLFMLEYGCTRGY